MLSGGSVVEFTIDRCVLLLVVLLCCELLWCVVDVLSHFAVVGGGVLSRTRVAHHVIVWLVGGVGGDVSRAICVILLFSRRNK